MTSKFSLVRDPWIVVRTLDHRVEEVSLSTLFDHASQYRGLGGELPTQEVAILRLLLAILARATAARRSHDDSMELWQEWWSSRTLPGDSIRKYLAQHEERFDLFDPTHPFMQVPGLGTASGSTSGLVKLIAEVPDGQKFFSLRLGPGLTSVSPAEAARWLVHAQSFDTSGIKTGVLGDDRVKGGRTYPLGTSYTGSLGVVLAEGTNLLETLLLNLCVDRVSVSDSVPWERDPDSAGPNPTHVAPGGFSDLFTWQSRRIRLIQEGGAVTDAVITYGDVLRPENLQHLETMAAFKLSDNLTRREKRDIFWPVRHNPDRSMWRGLNSWAAAGPGSTHVETPHIMSWLAGLREADAITDESVSIRTVGIEYGSQSATVARVIDDAMTGHVSAFTSQAVLAAAIDAAVLADELARSYANLIRQLQRAAGSGDAQPAGPYAAALYAAFDPEFRDWFSMLRVDGHLSEFNIQWQKRARRLALAEGRKSVQQAGPGAIRGQMRDDVPSFVSRFGILDAASILRAFERDVALKTPLANASPPRQEVPQDA